jgi:hypothetical protein
MPYRLLLTLVLAVAALLRFSGLFWGMPGETHPGFSYFEDEMYHLSWGLELYEGKYAATQFIYGGTLYFSFTTGVYKLGELLSGLLHNVNSLGDAIEVGRVIAATVSVLTVALTAAIGRRLFGPAVGLVAAAILAVSPGHVFMAKFLRPDQVAVFLATLLVWLTACAHGAAPRARLRLYAIMGVLLGAMLAFRFPLLLFSAAPLALAVLEWRASPAPRPSLLRDRALWLLVGLVPISYALLSPHSLLHPEWLRAGLELQWSFQSNFYVESIGRGPGVYQYGVLMLGDALGPPLCLAAFVGVACAAWRRSPAHLLLLAALTPYFLMTSQAALVVIRYILPIVPVLAVLAAAAIVDAVRAAGRLRAAVAGVAVLAVLVTAAADIAMLRVLARGDVRDFVTQWLAREAPAGTGVLEFMRYSSDRCFNPPLPPSVTARYFALETGSDPRAVANDGAAQLLVVHEQLTRESERVGAADPRIEIRALLELLAPGGAFREAARFKSPIEFLGIPFGSWFDSSDYLFFDPEIRLYARVAPPAP